MPWLSLYAGMDGFLRWAAWLWPNEPFDFESYHYQKFRAGGTHFVYPGRDGKPVYSLRYQNLKRGIRDQMILQEYMKKTGDRDGVKAAAGSLIRAGSLEAMQGKYRKTASEMIELDYEVYEKLIQRFLRQL